MDLSYYFMYIWSFYSSGHGEDGQAFLQRSMPSTAPLPTETFLGVLENVAVPLPMSLFQILDGLLKLQSLLSLCPHWLAPFNHPSPRVLTPLAHPCIWSFDCSLPLSVSFIYLFTHLSIHIYWAPTMCQVLSEALEMQWLSKTDRNPCHSGAYTPASPLFSISCSFPDSSKLCAL